MALPVASLNATESQIQFLILLNAKICISEESEAIQVWSPSFLTNEENNFSESLAPN